MEQENKLIEQDVQAEIVIEEAVQEEKVSASTDSFELPKKGMGWYKALIYGIIWAFVGLFVISAVLAYTGMHYPFVAGVSKNTVYKLTPYIAAINLIYSILCLGMAVVQVLLRASLTTFDRKAPAKAFWMYIISAAVILLYVVVMFIIVQAFIFWIEIILMGLCLVMAVINLIYFSGKKDIF